MKIIAVTDNYKDLKNKGTEPGSAWIFIPDSSIFRAPNPFYLEEETELAAAYPTIALRIDRLGKSIASRFASRYTAHIAIGVNLRNLTLENNLLEARCPVDKAWGYDKSLLMSDWIEMPLENMERSIITLTTEHSEGSAVSEKGASIIWRCEELITNLSGIIEKVSRMNTLKIGDIILPGFHKDGLVLIPKTKIKATLSTDLSDIPIETISIPIR